MLFHHIFTKWLPAAILVFRYSPKSIGFFLSKSSMAVSNMNLIRALVSQLRETQALACGGGGGDGVQTKTIISPKFQISGDIIMTIILSQLMTAHALILLPPRYRKIQNTD